MLFTDNAAVLQMKIGASHMLGNRAPLAYGDRLYDGGRNQTCTSKFAFSETEKSTAKGDSSTIDWQEAGD